jgi:Asp-tRNA(Asn)/Glu-tRNA(Gln) amidotransferase C subunit
MVPEDEVRHVADLARLGLTNDEVKKMGEELWSSWRASSR